MAGELVVLYASPGSAEGCGAASHVVLLALVLPKEYISLGERTAPPCRLKLRPLTQPFPDCSVSSYTDRQVV